MQFYTVRPRIIGSRRNITPGAAWSRKEWIPACAGMTTAKAPSRLPAALTLSCVAMTAKNWPLLDAKRFNLAPKGEEQGLSFMGISWNFPITASTQPKAAVYLDCSLVLFLFFFFYILPLPLPSCPRRRASRIQDCSAGTSIPRCHVNTRGHAVLCSKASDYGFQAEHYARGSLVPQRMDSRLRGNDDCKGTE